MNKLFNFTEGHYLSLSKQKIPLDCIFLIEMIINEKNVDSEEYLVYLQRLQRKGYIDGKQQLTKYGRELYESMSGETVAIKPKKRIDRNSDFDEWWSIYPSTDDFEVNGRHFQGTQKKNIKKDQCLILFTALCNSFKAKDIINATKYHIQMAKEISYKKRSNQLSFIPNSERYLREKYFEAYIEKSRKTEKTSENNEHEI